MVNLKGRIAPSVVLAAIACLLSFSLTAAQDNRPNVLFIALDDLNDWIEPLGGHPLARAFPPPTGDLPEIPSGGSCEQYTKPPLTDYQRERRNGCKLLTLHKATDHSEKMLEIIKHSGKNIHSIPKELITSGFSSCYSRLDGNEPAVTITVNFVHPASNRCIHPRLHRALTPREGARLQSFDDDFDFFGNRSQIVKQIGNAVPPLLGKAIAEELSRSVLS